MSGEQVGKAAVGKWSLTSYLRGRASRKEYWLWFLALFVTGLIFSLVSENLGSGMSFVFLAVQIRRLHDFGRSGWWLIPLSAIPLALPLTAFQLGLQGDTYPFDPAQFAKAEGWSNMALVASMLFMLATYIWMGIQRGDAGDNRFGPTPPTDLKSIFLGR